MSQSLWNDEIELPVRHLRIIDLTVMLPGPYVTRLLAQYGADVIKVEQIPEGDPLRHVPDTELFDLLNQGKRSVGVNLKSPEGVNLVKQLAGEADVFVENFREGVMDRLGLGYAELSEENPDLLYFSLRGLSGDKSVHAAHDLNFIATSGVGEWHLETGSPSYATQFGDLVGGTFVPTMQLLFHLANPARRGMHLMSSMSDSFRALFLPRAFDTYKGDQLPEEKKRKFGIHRLLSGRFPHSRYYLCRDKQWISLNAVQSKHWEIFCDVVDKADWKTRMEDESLVPEVEKLFSGAPASYWEALSSTRESCLFRVVPWEEHIEFSQAKPQLATDPMTWAGFQPNSNLRDVPELGSDTFAVLNSMGLSNKELSDWMQNGILFQSGKTS